MIVLNAAVWTKATRSNGNGGNNCVEVYLSPQSGDVLMRDSKQAGVADRTILAFTQQQWLLFLGEVEAEGMDWETVRTPGEDGRRFVVDDPEDEGSLFFTEAEWDAFVDGVRNGEFRG